MAHQVVTKDVAKTEFLLGIVCSIVDTIAIESFQHVQEKVAEMIRYLEAMRAFLRASRGRRRDRSVGRDGARMAAARRGPQHVSRACIRAWSRSFISWGRAV